MYLNLLFALSWDFIFFEVSKPQYCKTTRTSSSLQMTSVPIQRIPSKHVFSFWTTSIHWVMSPPLFSQISAHLLWETLKCLTHGIYPPYQVLFWVWLMCAKLMKTCLFRWISGKSIPLVKQCSTLWFWQWNLISTWRKKLCLMSALTQLWDKTPKGSAWRK